MKFLIALIACAIVYSEAKPANYDLVSGGNSWGDGVSQPGTTITECHGITCPAGTVACSKTTKTSSDKKTLLTTIQCEDFGGNILNSSTKSAENPFEDTQISSFSFTGHYNFNKGTNTQSVHKPSAYDGTYYNTYNNHNKYNNLDEQVETF